MYHVLMLPRISFGRLKSLGATSVVKISEVQLSDEIGGFEILKKMKFIITIRYEIPTFSFLERGRGSR